MAYTTQAVPGGSSTDPKCEVDSLSDGGLAQAIKILDGTAGSATPASVTASNALKVDGSAVTQPVSAASLPLPTGASTAAKQPALGTAGSASADVITVQGIASMTALKVDGSGVTQPISGTVTANIGTAGSLALDATLTGGTQKTKIVDSGGTNVATVSSGGAVKVDGSAVTQPVSGTVTANAGTGTFTVSGTVTANQGGTWTAATNADAAIGAGTAPSKALVAGGVYNSTEPSPTTGQTLALQLDSKGRQRTVLMDAAGNTRGANVNASNQLSVSVDGSSATNISTNVAQMNGVATAMGNGVSGTGVQRVTIASDSTGQVALASGSNVAGKFGIDQTTPGTTNAVQQIPGTSGGLSISRTLSAASTNSTSVKGSAGQVYAVYAHNTNAAVRYLKLYNKATAPTVGTDTPVMTLPIPGNTAGAGFVLECTSGIAFGTGIGLGITTGVADADTGAVAANEIVVNLLYK